MKPPYARSIFINCPFTDDYSAMFRALVFAVVDCGFHPRCAKEIVDGGENRLQKIETLIQQSKYGIHDLSNMGLDPDSGLPRLNMALELGLFLGAKRFAEKPQQKAKKLIILDSQKYRYQQAISDISGLDIESHENEPSKAIRCIRNWLQTVSRRTTLPGANHIIRRYKAYEIDLPDICKVLKYDADDLTFNDLWETMSDWIKLNG